MMKNKVPFEHKPNTNARERKMKRLISVLLIFSLTLYTPSLCLAEGLSGILENTFSDIKEAFSSAEISEQLENAAEDHFLVDIGSFVTDLLTGKTTLPKEFHYSNSKRFRKELDTLEKCFQAYADFIKTYNPDDPSMHQKYASIRKTYDEAMALYNSISESKITSRDDFYSIQTFIRIGDIFRQIPEGYR